MTTATSAGGGELAAPFRREGDARQVLTFEVGQDVWGIPLADLREVVEYEPLTPVPRAPACVEGVLMLHGRAIAIIPFAYLAAQPRLERTPDTRILVVNSDRFDVGVVVDRTGGIEMLEPQSSPAAARRGGETPGEKEQTPFLQALVQLKGQLVALVDTERLLARIEEEFLPTAAGAMN